jgi:hypothetical protein
MAAIESLPDTDALVERCDTTEELWEAVLEDSPGLPPRFQDYDREELLDVDARDMTEDEAKQVAEWAIYQREAGKRVKIAEERL